MNFQFTRQDFVREWQNLRELMGSKSFWAKPEDQRARALKGFSFVYLNADVQESDKMIFASAIQEYSARERMMIFSELRTSI